MSNVFTRALSPAVREIRLMFSQSGPASSGTRNFVLANYPVIKKHNQDLPILIREAEGHPPRAVVRFERGVEESVELHGLSSGEVESKVAQLLGIQKK